MAPSRILNRRNRATGATNTEARNPSHHPTPRINKKPDLPAGLLASPPEDYHAGGNRTNERTKQRIPTNTKATASTNQPKQAGARRRVPRVWCRLPCRRYVVSGMRPAIARMALQLSGMAGITVRVPGFDRALWRPPVRTCQPALGADADQTVRGGSPAGGR